MKLSKIEFVNFVNTCEQFEAKLMASLAGFEPATRCLEGSRSIQLSYRDIGAEQS